MEWLKGWAGAIVWRFCKGRLEVLVIDSKSVDSRYSKKPTQTKFPGGGRKKRKKERTPVLTMRRELWEETGLRLKPAVVPEEIHVVVENFPMFFYLIKEEDLEGKIRMHEILDGTDRLSSPYWISDEEAIKKVFRTHQMALLKALQHLGLMRK
ncbi:NUDIX hydrolase [Patescibacteria group bacterium]|nr:NUDIX hydrolase [Patescibacteria group bacterium]